MVQLMFKSTIGRRSLLRGLLVSGGTAVFGPLLAACSGAPAPSATAAPAATVARPTAVTNATPTPAAAPTQAPSPTVTTAPQATTAPSQTRYTLRHSELNDNNQLQTARQVLKVFMEKNPAITVNIEPIAGDYATKLYTEAAAHTLQDTIWTADVFTKPFAAKNIVRDMQPYANADKNFNIADIYPVMLDLGRTSLRPGGLFMLPRALDILVLFYNKTMFEKAGVGLPQKDWKIQDLIDAAVKLTKPTDDPKTTRYGINLPWNWWAEYVPWMRGYGGDLVSSDGKRFIGDQPEAVAGIQAMADLILKHKVAPPLTTSFGGDPFVLGNVAMTHTIRDVVPTFRNGIADKFEWDVQIWPAFPKKHVTGMGTQGYAFTTDSKHPDQAWQVVAFFVSKEGQEILAGNYTTIPVRISMANDPSWRNLPPPPSNNTVFIDSAAIGTLPPELPLGCGSVYTGQTSELMNNAIDKILRGKEKAESALHEVATQINSCIAQEG